jgi:hypothetical protein
MAGRSPTTRPPKDRRRSMDQPDSGDPCERTLQTHLSNVRPSAAGGLRVGSQLTVEVEETGGRRTLVCKRPSNDALVGTVLSRGASTMIGCISRGYHYTATITEMDLGLVEVLIRSQR